MKSKNIRTCNCTYIHTYIHPNFKRHLHVNKINSIQFQNNNEYLGHPNNQRAMVDVIALWFI